MLFIHVRIYFHFKKSYQHEIDNDL